MSLVLASIVALILYQVQTEVELINGTFPISGIRFFIALHVLYYAGKIGIILVFWGALIAAAANMMGFEWAANIVGAFAALVRFRRV